MAKTNKWKITVEPVEDTTRHTVVDLPADLTFAEVPHAACREVLERVIRLKQEEDDDWEDDMSELVGAIDGEALAKLSTLVTDELDFRKEEAEKASVRERVADEALDEIPF